MIFTLSIAGLILIIAGWFFQMIKILKGDRIINKLFVLFYIAGVALLVIHAYTNNLKSLAVFNLISMFISLMVLLALLRKKK